MPGPGAAQLYEPTSRSTVQSGTTEVAGPVTAPIIFSFDGALAVSESEAFEPIPGSSSMMWKILLRTAGTTDTVVSIIVNDSEVKATTIPAGETRVIDSKTYTINANQDRIVVGITTAGAGAAKLTVQLYLF